MKDTSQKAGGLDKARATSGPLRTYVVKDGRRFRLCTSERTPRGPRRVNLVTLGTESACSTVAGAVAYWKNVYDAALSDCRIEVEGYPDSYKRRRPWQRAAALCERARARITAIIPYV